MIQSSDLLQDMHLEGDGDSHPTNSINIHSNMDIDSDDSNTDSNADINSINNIDEDSVDELLHNLGILDIDSSEEDTTQVGDTPQVEDTTQVELDLSDIINEQNHYSMHRQIGVNLNNSEHYGEYLATYNQYYDDFKTKMETNNGSNYFAFKLPHHKIKRLSQVQIDKYIAEYIKDIVGYDIQLYREIVNYYLNNEPFSISSSKNYNLFGGVVIAKITEYPNTMVELDNIENISDYSLISKHSVKSDLGGTNGLIIDSTIDNALFKKNKNIIRVDYLMIDRLYGYGYNSGETPICQLGKELIKLTLAENLCNSDDLKDMNLSKTDGCAFYNQQFNLTIKTLYEYLTFDISKKNNLSTNVHTINDTLVEYNTLLNLNKNVRCPIYLYYNSSNAYSGSYNYSKSLNVSFDTRIIMTNYSLSSIKMLDILPFWFTIANKRKLCDTIHGNFGICFKQSINMFPYSSNTTVKNNNYTSFLVTLLEHRHILKDAFKFKLCKDNSNVSVELFIKKKVMKHMIDNNEYILDYICQLLKVNTIKKWDADVYVNSINSNHNDEQRYIYNKDTFNGTPSLDTMIADTITLPLFSYQKSNVVWMKDLESNILDRKCAYPCYIDEKTISKNLPTLTNRIVENSYNSSLYLQDKHLIKYFMVDGKKIIIHPQVINGSKKPVLHQLGDYDTYITKNTHPITINGGIICDEVGLGKTLSTVSHLITHLSSDKENKSLGKLDYLVNNVIILPGRLINQWIYEISKYVKPNIKYSLIKLATFTDIKKLEKTISKDKHVLKNTDIIIMCSNLLINQKYKTYLEEKIKQNISTSKYFDLFNTKINRIIIDEIHEILIPYEPYGEQYGNMLYDKSKHKSLNKSGRELSDSIYDLECNFKWCLTATPFEYGPYNLMGIMQYLIGRTQRRKYQLNIRDFDCVKGINSLAVMSTIVKSHFKGIKKSEVRSEIDIPIFTEKIIRIPLSNIEKNIYNTFNVLNYSRDKNYIKKLFLICTNIYIADVLLESSNDTQDDINSQKVVTLEDLNKAMIFKFKKLKLKVEKEKKEVLTSIGEHKQLSDHYDYINNCFKHSKLFNKEIFKSYYNEDKYYLMDTLNMYKECITKETNIEVFCKSSNNYRATALLHILHKMNEYLTNINSSPLSDNTNSNQISLSEIHNSNQISLSEIHSSITKVIECDSIASYNLILQMNYNNKKMNTNTLIGFMSKVSNIHYVLHHSKYESFLGQNNSLDSDIRRYDNQIKLFSNNEFIKEKTSDPCMICFDEFDKVVVTKCRHVYCGGCHVIMSKNKQTYPCPECRTPVIPSQIIMTTMENINIANNKQDEQSVNSGDSNGETDSVNEIQKIDYNDMTTEEILKLKEWRHLCINKYGSKMTYLIEYLQGILQDSDNRVIIFSQYDQMLNLIGKTLDEYKIKNVFCKGNVNTVNKRIHMFKTDTSIRVIMLSSEKSSSGSNLTEANHIILVDVLNAEKSTTKDMESQAIGRAVRLGQKKPVTVTRLITTGTIEDEYYSKNKYDIAELQ